MATGEDLSATLAEASEFIYQFCCSLCSKSGDITEAVHQCLDCNEFLCDKCIRIHNNLGATSGHKVLTGKDMRQVKSSKSKKPLPPSQLCQENGGDLFAVYFSINDVVCCNTGFSVDHNDIVDAADGNKSSKSIQTTKTKISSTLKEVKRCKSSRQSYLADLDKDKASNIKQVEDFTERLIKRIRELKNATIETITSKHKELSEDVGREVASLDDVISTMEGDLQRLDRRHGIHEAQIFVDVKLSQSHEAEGRKLLQQFSKPHKPSLKFILRVNIEDLLKGLNSLASFADGSHVFKATLKSEYNVKVKQDTNTCRINGSYQLPDGTVVITDYYNNRLKRLDASYSVTDHCDMPSEPWGVTCTAPDEVAVTMTVQKKVQFVSVRDSMSLSRSFSTSDRCRGILYSGGKLYVACGGMTKKDFGEGPGHVAIYTLKGEQLKKVQTDITGQNIFSCPSHITASCDGDRVFVAQNKEGSTCIQYSVVVLDRDGTLVGSIADPSLNRAWGLCTLDNGHILICGLYSNNVLQFDGDGRKVTELLKDKDGIKMPKSLCYDSRNSTCIVSMHDTDTIKVFDLK